MLHHSDLTRQPCLRHAVLALAASTARKSISGHPASLLSVPLLSAHICGDSTMFADTRSQLLQALRFIVDTPNNEPNPAAASSVILRWLDRELRDIEVIIVPRTHKAVQIIDLLGDELARAVARGLADDDQVASTRLAIRKVIDAIEDDLDADAEYRLVS